jgi:hypothetical protein
MLKSPSFRRQIIQQCSCSKGTGQKAKAPLLQEVFATQCQCDRAVSRIWKSDDIFVKRNSNILMMGWKDRRMVSL